MMRNKISELTTWINTLSINDEDQRLCITAAQLKIQFLKFNITEILLIQEDQVRQAAIQAEQAKQAAIQAEQTKQAAIQAEQAKQAAILAERDVSLWGWASIIMDIQTLTI